MSEKVETVEKNTPQEGEFKMKKKPGRPKKLNKTSEPIKIDLSKEKETKKEDNAVQELQTGNVDEKQPVPPVEGVEGDVRELPESGNTTTGSPEEKEEIKEVIKPTEEEKPLIEEINIGEEKNEPEPQVAQAVDTPKVDLPENIEKLVEFMKETGGDIQDYIRLNADYSNINDDALISEFYRKTKSHLDQEEINFIIEDKFYYDEDMDEEREIRKKKLAKKEEVAKAKQFLDDLKSKYYEEIKLRPGVTQEQQKATDFFNRYKKEQDANKQKHEDFIQQTQNYFSNDFKGFEINVGEKRFRYGVKNTQEVADAQSNISQFLKKFLAEDGSVKDHKGYHKAIYAARNIDTIAKHFYDQGMADGTKNIVAKSKNISNEPRENKSGEVFLNGMRVKAVSGVDSSKLKIKTRNK